MLATVCLVFLLAASTAAASDEMEAAEAMHRMLDSQGAVLDALDAIEDEVSLDRNREALKQALAQARSETEALADHAKTIASNSALQAVMRPQLLAYNARRQAVHSSLVERLDEAMLDKLEAIFAAAD